MVVLDREEPGSEPALTGLVQEVPDPKAPAQGVLAQEVLDQGGSGQGVLVQELPRQKVPGL